MRQLLHRWLHSLYLSYSTLVCFHKYVSNIFDFSQGALATRVYCIKGMLDTVLVLSITYVSYKKGAMSHRYVSNSIGVCANTYVNWNTLLYLYRARSKITHLSIPTHAQLQRHRLKFIKNHLKTPTCFGLRPPSGSYNVLAKITIIWPQLDVY